MEGYKEAYSTLRYPFADTITGAFLYTGNKGGIVDNAVEYLALRRLGWAHGDAGLLCSRWDCIATHFGQRTLWAKAKV